MTNLVFLILVPLSFSVRKHSLLMCLLPRQTTTIPRCISLVSFKIVQSDWLAHPPALITIPMQVQISPMQITLEIRSKFSVFLVFLSEFSLLLESTQIDYDIKNLDCEAAGTEHIYIAWTTSRIGNYSVYFCKLPSSSFCQNVSEFKFGCTKEVLLPNVRQQCNIAAAAAFDPVDLFNYSVQSVSGNGPMVTAFKRCLLSVKMKCSRMTGLELTTPSRGSLCLSWNKPDMGQMSNQLCYKITYAPVGANSLLNLTVTKMIEDAYTYDLPPTLSPFTTYQVFAQCSLSCKGGWGEAAGPITGTLLEEAGGGARNTGVFMGTDKLPQKSYWYGVIREIKVTCLEESLDNSTLQKSVIRENYTGGDTGYQAITLSPLQRHKGYTVHAVYCNSAGCSPQGDGLQIPSQDTDPLPFKAPSRSSGQALFVGVGCGLAVVAVVIIVVLVCRFCPLERRRRGQRIEEVFPYPIAPMVSEASLPTGSANEYGNLYSAAASATSLNRSVYNTDASSLVSQRTEDRLSVDGRDFSNASVRSLRSCNSLPCMTENERSRNAIPEEEGQEASSGVLHDDCFGPSSFDVELPLIKVNLRDEDKMT
ncbi:uncharacterized protein LOC116618851 isoform X2 [Nematostella vectensis]|uniref:uncharacterized protein LOC116618851 isoform X2 n=1 Tax=Nematostella vectensis TaxID=45351 RepID=UPI00207787F9|nr:uncharacterized protein LOC116618851 isoform X2 [Nematostella vectensis]